MIRIERPPYEHASPQDRPAPRRIGPHRRSAVRGGGSRFGRNLHDHHQRGSGVQLLRHGERRVRLRRRGVPLKVGVTVDNLDNGNRLFGTSSYAPVCDGNFHSFRVTANKRLAPTPVTFSRGDTAAVTAYLADSSSGYSIVEDSGFYTL